MINNNLHRSVRVAAAVFSDEVQHPFKRLKLSHQRPETSPEPAAVQFQLRCEEVKLFLSICALLAEVDPKPAECPVKLVLQPV